MDTFNPGYAPDINTETQFDARVISNKFGDGYRQTAPDGLNTTASTVPLTWQSVPIATAQAMHDFLMAHVGQPFYYTLPRETTPRVYDCIQWKRGYPMGGYDSFSCSLTERFDFS